MNFLDMLDFLQPKVPTIQVDDVKQAMDNKNDFTLLDVRTPGEISKGKLAGSINIPIDGVAAKVESLLPDKNRLTYVYCLSGSRSAHAVQTMVKLGYTNVFHVDHGLLAWRIKQYPVESKHSFSRNPLKAPLPFTSRPQDTYLSSRA